MPYFLDSNVIIGYIFYTTDHWGNAAVRAFEDDEPNHSGRSVQNECFGLGETNSGKVKTIRKNVSAVLRRAIFRLKKGNTLDQIIADSDRTDREILANLKAVAAVSPGRVLDKTVLEASLRSFEFEAIQRQRVVERQCTWHRRNTLYPDIYNDLHQHIPDKDDVTVILDAHDIAQTIADLVFVSGDYTHIIHHSDIIQAQTQITRVLGLGHFVQTSAS